MKKFLLGLIIGLVLVNIVYGYRIAKPQRITAFDQNGLVALNETLERLWDITNGRYNLNVVRAAPGGAGTEGDMQGYWNGTTFRLYAYINGRWRDFQSTAGTGVDVVLLENGSGILLENGTDNILLE